MARTMKIEILPNTTMLRAGLARAELKTLAFRARSLMAELDCCMKRVDELLDNAEE